MNMRPETADSPRDLAHVGVSLPRIVDRSGTIIRDALRSSLAHDESFVYDMLRYYMGWGDETGAPVDASTGKAVRPALCLFGCEAVGGDAVRALPAAVALEFVHNFSLIHDDIQDEDETRHSRSTLWAVWGKPKALVAGNVLRSVADMSLEGLRDAGLESEVALTAISLLTESYLEMIEGQYLDLAFEGRHDICMDDYNRMISRKTGALIRCSLNIGAVVGTNDRETVSAFRECGSALGYLFQIRDDVLGVWGDEAVTGKPVGADIRRKKNSYPIVYTMETASQRDRDILARIYDKPELDAADVAQVLTVMENVGVQRRARAETGIWADRAMNALSAVDLRPEARRDFEEFTHFLMTRNR